MTAIKDLSNRRKGGVSQKTKKRGVAMADEANRGNMLMGLMLQCVFTVLDLMLEIGRQFRDWLLSLRGETEEALHLDVGEVRESVEERDTRENEILVSRPHVIEVPVKNEVFRAMRRVAGRDEEEWPVAGRPEFPDNKFYAVAKGRKPGVYATWEECKVQVLGFSNGKYKKFLSYADAERFVHTGR